MLALTTGAPAACSRRGADLRSSSAPSFSWRQVSGLPFTTQRPGAHAQRRFLGPSPCAAAGPEAGQKSEQSPSPSPDGEPVVPEGTNLTTWQYSKLKDPGFGPWFVSLAFLPFLLLLVPLLSSPPMPPMGSP